MSDRNQEIDRARKGAHLLAADLEQVYEWWGAHAELLGHAAADEFSERVQPCVRAGADAELVIAFADRAYSEWVLLERPLDGRSETALEYYLARGPVLDGGAQERLERAAATQFFSRFAILGVDGESGICEMWDTWSGGRYRVVSDTVAGQDSWREGTVGVRIAQVTDGAWAAIGQTYLYDRAPADLSHADLDLWGTGQRARRGGGRYLEQVRDCIGMCGRYTASATVRRHEGGA